jgi:AcrR family transcriptional regulator
MDILEKKPGTKRPVIVRSATSLFARRGIDGTSMREIAEAAGVRDAAIYRHFTGKDDLAREIFRSWYGWHCRELQRIVNGPGDTLDKIRLIVRHEFAAVTDHGEAFVYFCKNEMRFLRSLPPEATNARSILIAFIKAGQARRKIRAGSAELLADMLGGALCAVGVAWLRSGRRGKLSAQFEEAVQGCWHLLARR